MPPSWGTATARTEVRIRYDRGMGDADDAKIAGITVDLMMLYSRPLTLWIPMPQWGNNDIVASANSAGELVLVSASGQNIVFDDG